MALLLCAGLSLLGALRPLAACADEDTPKAKAERFFLRGKDLMAAGHYVEACVAFDESLRIDRAGGTLLNLAECYVAQGRFASARAQLVEAQKLAASAHRDDKAQFAAHRLGEIEPHVDYVNIRLPPAAATVYKVTLDGRAIDSAAAKDARIPVDPGVHTIQATGRGFRTIEMGFEIHGEHSDLTLFIPTLAAVEPKSAQIDTRAVETRRTPQWTIGWSVGSVGVAGLLVGAGLGGAAIAKWHDAKNRCPSRMCADPAGVSETAQAETFADGSTVAFGIGAATAVLGVVLIATSPHEKTRTQVRLGAQSLSLEGVF